MNEQSDLVKARRLKAAQIRERGVDPYGGRFDDPVSAADVLADFRDGRSVRVAGRLWLLRRMGKSTFAHVRDSTARIQVYFQKDVLGDEGYELVRLLDLGDVVGVDGETFRTRTGEPTIRVTGLTLLAKALRPPPEKWHGLADVETRYRQRYLDLMARDEAKDLFRTRAAVVREIRAFLAGRGYLEVETPMIQALAGGALARPFRTRFEALGADMFLRIAPELYLKRLLVGGFEKVFELNRNFRNEGLSRQHNPEFTMLECYQAYGDCRTIMEVTQSLIVHVARTVLGTLRVPGARETDGPKDASGPEEAPPEAPAGRIDLTPPWPQRAYRDLIRGAAGEDWFDVPLAERVRRAREMGLDVDEGIPEALITQEVYEKRVEPALIQPTFVVRLDAELVPLARRCDDDPRLVDVYELVIDGQEISPGYSELNDPDEQRRRFEEQQAAARARGEESAIDEDFLSALEHGMPPAGGMGLGVDRLVMILTGAPSIREVILFPQLRQR